MVCFVRMKLQSNERRVDYAIVNPLVQKGGLQLNLIQDKVNILVTTS